jgi:stage V sporulation protein G
MPSRKICERCARCGCKNHLRAKFCNDCGNRLPVPPPAPESDARVKLHADIAHPINAASREAMQKRIIEAYTVEVEKSKLPGYKPVEIYESSEEYDL